MFMSGRWNGQTKAEFAKNYKRVKDIVDKSAGDVDKAYKLSQTQANRITDEFKALNRAMAARQTTSSNNGEVYKVIYETFFQRAYELGSVSKQDYREYKLEKLGL
jgi:GH15 family glucan-1,4-alpha-glucosidase